MLVVQPILLRYARAKSVGAETNTLDGHLRRSDPYSGQTLRLRTLRGEIDPGESEFDVEEACCKTRMSEESGPKPVFRGVIDPRESESKVEEACRDRNRYR